MSQFLNKWSRRCLIKCDHLLLKRTIKKQTLHPPRLAEVGKVMEPRECSYETGQLFLHRVFGYRGMILFPWTARVYDRDLRKSHKKTTTNAAAVHPMQPLHQAESSASASTTAADGKPPSGEKCLDKGPTTTTSTSTSTTKSYGTLQNDAGTRAGAGAGAASQSQSESTNKHQQQPHYWPSEDYPDPYLSYFDDMDSPFSSPFATPFLTSPYSSGSSSTTIPRNPKPYKEFSQIQTFYQVLIDSRDCPFVRAQTESVTFLGNQDSNRNLYAIPGLDNASHSDIMPYWSTDKQPIHHELFDKFLTYNSSHDPPFVALDTLQAWKEKNHPWLDMTDVHKETTEHVRITVIPFYMGVRETPVTSVYWWRYCIRLENLSNLTVQLRERHWRIFSLSGTLETVRGRGVVGQEPILSPTLPAFQYSSHVSLQSPSGHMWGTFRLEREDGYSFDCKIPPFSLDSKPEDAFPTGPTLPPNNTSEYSTTRTADDIENSLTDKTEAADTTNGCSSTSNWITDEKQTNLNEDDTDH